VTYPHLYMHNLWYLLALIIVSHFAFRQVNEQSQAQKLRSTLQRCFKAVDNAECGFIPAMALKEVRACLLSLLVQLQ
jgi:hypothetical protein